MNFGSLQAQYDEATRRAGVVHLDGWSSVRIEGADRAAFLHNMCTNDIRNLAVGQSCEAFLTDVKGKIVGHLLAVAGADRLLLLTVPGQAENLIRHLDRYIIREDVRLTDSSAELLWSLVVGPQAADAVERLRYDQTTPLATGGAPVVAGNWLWPGAYLAAGPAGPAGRGSDTGAASASDGEIAILDEAIWHALRIESGWPLFGVDFDRSNLPQEVGRDVQAINFRKGCYLGQETIARIDALGHVNRRLATVRLTAAAAAGDELIADGQVVGRISSASYSPRLDAWLALAMSRRGHNEPGTALQCNNLAAEIVPTPAVTP